MSITRCRHLAVLIVCGCLPAVLPLYGLDVQTASPPPASAQVQPDSNATYPQIVRISYADGDVRVSRGKKGATWETAVTGLPLETGFNLVTGKGKAEIEFEDASILYLGENSALALNDLRTTAGVPHTELALLAGTATLNLDETIAGESFTLDTPTHSIVVHYPSRIYERVSSYLDALAITPLKKRNLPAVCNQNTDRDLQRDRRGNETKRPCRVRRLGQLGSKPRRRAICHHDRDDEGFRAYHSASRPGRHERPGNLLSLRPLRNLLGAVQPAQRTNKRRVARDKHDVPFEAAQISVPPPQPASAMPQPVGPKPSAPVLRDTFFPCPPTRVRSLVARDPITGRQNVLYSTTTTMPMTGQCVMPEPGSITSIATLGGWRQKAPSLPGPLGQEWTQSRLCSDPSERCAGQSSAQSGAWGLRLD